MNEKTILILGAGEVGEACAIKSIQHNPKRIILHTLTEEESAIALENVKKHLDGRQIELVQSWGDALVTVPLMQMSREETRQPNNRRQLINYYYSYLSDDLIKQSSLYHLIQQHKPDYIFDGINTATVIGYQDDPYSLSRSIINGQSQDYEDSTDSLLAANIVPSIIRFTQALKKSLVDHNVTCYVKVSTTGLGGMGDNLFYTHGDVNEPGMSSGILGKVAAAGIIHQLLWSLSHTPGINIKVVVPAALIGWQGINHGKFRSHGKSLPLVDSTTKTTLKDDQILTPVNCNQLAEYMEMPYVDSGENCAYSLGEMTAITALGQMECITREEVAQACIEMALGSTRRDLLTAMDLVAMGPSHSGAVHRQIILDKLARLEIEASTPSIATNNLGPTVSKHLFELQLMIECSDKSLNECVRLPLDTLTDRIHKYIDNNQQIRSQILSLGLPIIFNDSQVIMSEYFYVPNPKEDNIINKQNIDLWASSGWIDLRKDNISYWQSVIAKIVVEHEKNSATGIAFADRNHIDVNNPNVGELLGYAYSMMGGHRKTEFLK